MGLGGVSFTNESSTDFDLRGDYHSSKTVYTDDGVIEIDVPRDRESSFEPQLIKKQQTRLTGMDDKILFLYAQGMTTREICMHLKRCM